MQVLLVSKPLCPPWRDSGKNWARDVATFASVRGIVHRVMVPAGRDDWSAVEGVVAEGIYTADGSYAPRIADNVRTLRRILKRRDGCDLVHFCFAPNPRSNRIAGAAMKWRRQPSVHTVLSVPASFESVGQILFADRVVCVSASTADRLSEVGVKGLAVVPAAIPLEVPLRDADPKRVADVVSALGLGSGRPLVVFPGDYEFSAAADVFAGAVERLWDRVEADFVFACRKKSPASITREVAIKARLSPAFAAGRVHFLGELDDMRGLLAGARVVALPAESTYAKMDIPLVVLEAMAERTPVILADVAPLREALGPEPRSAGGALVPPLDEAGLSLAIEDLLGDTAAFKERGQLARAHVEARHDAAMVCQQYAALYEGLV